MKTTLRNDITVRELCDGFEYNELENKGLFGMGGRLTIQPEYQRNYIYKEMHKEEAVIKSLLQQYPLGLLYFVKNPDGSLEVLDGQQRVTSIGRFLTMKFAITDENGMQQNYDGLDEETQELILNTPLLVYECEGTEKEIKHWFETVNIAGVPLNQQELYNAIYSGPFVSAAKKVFSNSTNPRMQKWSSYIKGRVNRQEYLECALDWVSKGDISGYMSSHRRDTDIKEMEKYFNDVIDWADSLFEYVTKEMQGLEWGRLYETYRHKSYDKAYINSRVSALFNDPCVTERKGIYEYVLGGENSVKLLDIRVFDPKTKNRVYAKQTAKAKKNSISNCPVCVLENKANKKRIWTLKEMEADHVTAWSNGGSTSEDNCQMLCIFHNRLKGNR
ncbi:MAG: DUF262 domain-containing protein [Prevotellaceae bacterium]|nr:DUF262 domain-containing protein [Prevotellaceae bacterium]